MAGKPWTREDDGILRACAGFLAVETIARQMGRTPTALRVRAKRLGLRWYVPNPRRQEHRGYTAREVARLLGVGCAKTVTRWIAAGHLDGGRHSIRMGPNQLWRVYPDALERFLRAYPWLYDPARVTDPLWRAYVAALPRVRYVTVGEAARLLPYTESGISQLIRRGDLPAVKHGRNWKIPLPAIRAFNPPPIGYASEDQRDEVRARRERNLRGRGAA